MEFHGSSIAPKIYRALLKKRCPPRTCPPISNREEAGTRLIFYARMCNEAAVVVAKDADVFLLLVYVLGQLECFLLP